MLTARDAIRANFTLYILSDSWSEMFTCDLFIQDPVTLEFLISNQNKDTILMTGLFNVNSFSTLFTLIFNELTRFWSNIRKQGVFDIQLAQLFMPWQHAIF